jgi:hypothetical protein
MIRKGSPCNDQRLNYRRDSFYIKLQAALGTGSDIMMRRVSVPGTFEEGLAYTTAISSENKAVKTVKTAQSSADILTKALTSTELEPSVVTPCANLRILLVEVYIYINT